MADLTMPDDPEVATITVMDLTDTLLAGIKEARAGLLGESNWAGRVNELDKLGALNELYSLGANLGWTHADIRVTIWSGAVEALA